MECHVAGVQYYEANEVWEHLKIGTVLRLKRDSENKHDPDAVAVVYFDKELEEETKIGYISSDENSELANFLDMGHEDIFEARLSKINPEAHYEKQLHVKIKILQKI